MVFAKPVIEYAYKLDHHWGVDANRQTVTRTLVCTSVYAVLTQ